jgi:hypothetical protein
MLQHIENLFNIIMSVFSNSIRYKLTREDIKNIVILLEFLEKYTIFEDKGIDGLCQFIRHLYTHKHIKEKRADSIYITLAKIPPHILFPKDFEDGNSPYWFPITNKLARVTYLKRILYYLSN